MGSKHKHKKSNKNNNLANRDNDTTFLQIVEGLSSDELLCGFLVSAVSTLTGKEFSHLFFSESFAMKLSTGCSVSPVSLTENSSHGSGVNNSKNHNISPI
jgi:hypothetical protein